MNNSYQLEEYKKTKDMTEISKDIAEFIYQKNSCYLFNINQFIQKMNYKYQMEFDVFNSLFNTGRVRYWNPVYYIRKFLIFVYIVKLCN